MVIWGCKDSPVSDQPVASVSGKILYQSDLKSIIPEDISKADSSIMAEDYIKKWVTKELLIKKAEENLTPEYMDVTRELEEYRQSLIIYKYKKELVRQKMDTAVVMEEIEKYYNENPNNFLLSDNIVKAVYIKLPKEVARPEKIKLYCQGNSEEDLSVLKEYCLQYAKTFDVFDGNWIEFNKVAVHIPLDIPDQRIFLTRKKNVEVTDDDYFYFVCINDYRLAGQPAPVEYVSGQIKNLILNKRKIEFLKNIENEIYEDGIRTNKFRIYN